MVKCTKGQVRRLKTALRWKGDPQRRQRIQMVLLRESEMTQPAIAGALGVSLSTVNRAHMAYDRGGLKALKSKPSGGRKRENITLAEEKVLLARFAKAAGAGEMLNIHDLKAAYWPEWQREDIYHDLDSGQLRLYRGWCRQFRLCCSEPPRQGPW